MGQTSSTTTDGSANPDAAKMSEDAKLVLAVTRIAAVWKRKAAMKRLKQLRAEKEAAAPQVPAPAPEEKQAPAPVEQKPAPAEAPVSAAPVTAQQETIKPGPVTPKPASPSAAGKQQRPQQQRQQQQGKGKGKEGKEGGGVRGGVRLHVKNLGPSVSTQQLKTLFQPYGRVLEAEAKAFDDGRCKGFGFVVLSNMEEANKAVAEANGTKVDGKNIIVIIVDNKLKGDKGGKKGGKADGKGGEFVKGKGFGKGEFVNGKGFGKAGKGTGQLGASGDGPAAAVQAQQAYLQGGMPYGGYGGASGQNPSLNPYWYNYPAHAQAQVVAAHAAWWHSAYQVAQLQAQMQQWSPSGATCSPGQVQATEAAAQSSATQAADATPAARGKKGRGRKGGEENAEATPPLNLEQPQAGKDYRGALKSLSDKHGYGFICCEDAKHLYDRDVWVDSDALPESAKVGARLIFNMTLSPKGHPQAQNVRVAR